MVPLLTTVRRFLDLSEALIARSMLQSSGIDAQLCDENMVRIDWGVTNAIGGIRLQVRQEEAEDAIALLDAPPLDEMMSEDDGF